MYGCSSFPKIAFCFSIISVMGEWKEKAMSETNPYLDTTVGLSFLV
jgi:hypothetical protein